MKNLQALTTGGVALCLASCFLSPLPDMKTAADRARAVEPKCVSISDTKVASLASPASIESVEPSYSFVPSTGTDHEARLRGALLHVRPVAGLSKEALARGLECHEARVTLGRATPFVDDPYTLADHWLSIDVDSEGDGFAVNVRADDFRSAGRVLERAKLFASSAPPGAAPP
jgi:hypothetical protein